LRIGQKWAGEPVEMVNTGIMPDSDKPMRKRHPNFVRFTKNGSGNMGIVSYRVGRDNISTKYHLCLDISGALKNWNPRHFDRVITDDDGRLLTAVEAKKSLQDQLAMGRKVIPSSECDNFDYEHGCLGHVMEDEVN
jgi:hypothetical protein